MTKYLISTFFCLFFIISCNEIIVDNISSTIEKSSEKIESYVVSKKNITENVETNKLSNNENIFYYIGDPYFIEGVKYIPEENYLYSEVGLATYYGKELHNIKTINNDMNKVTELLGRHKTLPIPSLVKITNLDNGLSINIKIVDRHKDNASLVQVSRKVAQLLGFYKDKIATVKLEILSDASKQWKNVSMSLNEPQFEETISSAPTAIVSITDLDSTDTLSEEINTKKNTPIEISSEEVTNYKLYLKVNNFINEENMILLIKKFDNKIPYIYEQNGSNYNLIIGPVNKSEANKLVSYFIAKGYKETEIILK